MTEIDRNTAEAAWDAEEETEPLYRCMMVTTGQEEYVVRLMKAIHLGNGITPKRIRIRHSHNEWKQDMVPMLPGYVFIREEEEISLWRYQELQDVIRVLRYDQEPKGYMRARDLRFAQTLFRLEGVVSPLQAVDEGDYIRITDGLLKDMNGTVLSVDRHKRQAKIRLELMGIPKVIYMNYVLLEKQEKAEKADGSTTRPQEEKGEDGR